MKKHVNIIVLVERWAKRVGRNVAIPRLMSFGIGVATAERLVDGSYYRYVKSGPSYRLVLSLESLLKEEKEAS